MAGLEVFRVAVGACRCGAGEGEDGVSVTRGDDDPSFTAFVAALKIDGTGQDLFAGFGEDSEMVFGVGGSDFGFHFVDS